MQKTSDKLKSREMAFASSYRGLQHAISGFTGEPQPPCYFCTDHQIWKCSQSGRECDTFTRYYSNYEL